MERNEQISRQELPGRGWKNAYVVYIILTAALFGFLVFMGWIAWSNGWLPSR